MPRLRGTIQQWNDSRGFGFILSGKERFFFHIKSVKERNSRPATGDIVTFERSCDSQNRPNAISVDINSKKTGSSGVIHRGVVASLGVFIAAAVFMGKLPPVIAFTDLIASLLLFILYGVDKRRARRGKWRIPEVTLQLISLLGGWPGGYAAQREFRHKTRKLSFQLIFIITVIMNIGFHLYIAGIVMI